MRNNLYTFSFRREQTMKKSIIRIFCFCLILVLVLKYTNDIFKVKHGDGIYDLTKFYELKDNTVDLLILGSSHAFEDFNTGVLWNEYGISSFVLGGSMQPMWNTYYYLKEALKTQTPQLIILEGYATSFYSEYSDDSRIIKNNYGLRWSKDKVDSIKISSPRERWEDFLLEYSQYHARYAELSKDDFLKNQGNPLFKDWKGFGCNMDTVSFEYTDVSSVIETAQLYEKTEKYYRMTIELAQENNIPILIVISPYAGISIQEQTCFNSAKEIAKEYNVPFINYNLLFDEIGLDYSTDMADGNHLNYRGNQKFSLEVGAYIKKNFDIIDHRGEADYQTWQNNADYITTMIENQMLLECVDKNDLINKLTNTNYHLIISLDGNYMANKDVVYDFLNQLNISEAINAEKSIYYKDNGDGILWEGGEKDVEQYFRLDSHDLLIRNVFDELTATYINEIIIDNMQYKKVANGINVIVYDTVTQNVIDSFGLNADDAYNVVR